MAVHFPSTAFAARTITLGLSRTDRRAIEAQIEALIDLLDTLDGDADMEDDDPAGDPLDRGEMADYMDIPPLYAADQSLGPINLDRAYEDYLNLRRAA